VAGWSELKGDAARPQDGVPICLRGDLAQAYADLERQLAAANGRDQGSIVGGAEAAEIAERMAALAEQMSAFTYRFTFRALPRKQWRDMVDAHPPREEAEDRLNRVNMETFPVALIAASCVGIQPVADESPIPPDAPRALSDDDAQDMADSLTDGQIAAMFACAARLNRSAVDLPKCGSASEIMAKLALSSKPPEPGV
jgi:hypothetical protein